MADTRDAHRDQPLPTPGQQPVQDALIAAVRERRAYGIRKYGRPLETHNGRDALTDAWEEALDLVTYLTQMRLERGDNLPSLNGAEERDEAEAQARLDVLADLLPPAALTPCTCRQAVHAREHKGRPPVPGCVWCAPTPDIRPNRPTAARAVDLTLPEPAANQEA